MRVILVTSVMLGSLLGVTMWLLATNATADRSSSSATSPVSDTAPLVPHAETTALSPTTTAPPSSRVAYVISRPGTALHPSPDESGRSIAGGILLPVIASHADGYRVLDTCNLEGWVSANDVEVGTVLDSRTAGRFDQSVFVIDPGHGLPDIGAVGPTGLTETEVNLDVASRLVDLLRNPHDIDWATRAVTTGDSVPAAATAVLTRSPDGPNGGDYQLGLTFRATVANSVDATAFVSIHHNTAPETPLDHPGSEAFVSVSDPESARLGGLIVQELRAGLARFEAAWAGSEGSGVITRIDPDGSDYYTLLNRSAVPAVIVEGAYISNPTEEALAMTDEFRQAYAEAVYRGLVRLVTTDHDPIPAPEPVVWDVDIPGPSMAGCEVPAP